MMTPIGWNLVADELLIKFNAFEKEIKDGFDEAGESLVQQFKEEQFSGRGSDNMGLNIITGMTRASIRSLVESAEQGLLSLEIYNMTEDAHGVTDKQGFGIISFHQFGMGNNPKRLTLEEGFEDYGMKKLEDIVEIGFEVLVA